nr:PREDICTED: uncharacterized protein LOC109032190 isoform X2 [Bemisia tabaci]
MIPVKSFALLCLWPALQAWQIPESCDYISLYREMGCTPIFESGKECPVAYNCDKFTKVDPKSCYYNGNTYQKGYQLNDTETMDHCHHHCRCRDSYPQTAHAEWICAHGECPFPREEGCIDQYDSMKDCCRTRKYCEGIHPKPAITCAYNGVTYIEGQIIYDETKCKRCICNANFKDTLEGPSCQTQRCGTMLNYMHRLREGCVPVYYKSAHCSCSIETKCPEPTDSIIPDTKQLSSSTSSGRTCRFGNLTLYPGEQLKKRRTELFECSCKTPPFITCIQPMHQPMHQPLPEATSEKSMIIGKEEAKPTMMHEKKDTHDQDV